MAKATGYTCDRKECSEFKVADHLPPGWLQLKVQLNTEPGGDQSQHFDLCSNKCLAILATERAKADGESLRGLGAVGSKGPRRYKSPASLEAARRNGRRTSHVTNHEKKGVVVEDCEFCQEATAPIPTP